MAAARIPETLEDPEALRYLAEEFFGRRVLMTDRHDWTSAEIVEAYRGQSEAERAFRDLKNPYHLAVRPTFHWTDQKLQVHTFCCVLGYLLVKLLEIKARQSVGYRRSPGDLLERLASVRQVTMLEAPEGRGRPRVRTQLEMLDPEPGYQCIRRPPRQPTRSQQPGPIQRPSRRKLTLGF